MIVTHGDTIKIHETQTDTQTDTSSDDKHTLRMGVDFKDLFYLDDIT